MNRQRKLAIAGVTGAMLIGAGTGVVLNLPSGAGASGGAGVATIATDPPSDPVATDSAGTSDGTTDTTSTPASGDSTTPPAGPMGRHSDVLKSSLDELVTAGTITQAQEDAIIAGIEANRPTPPDGQVPGGDGGGFPGQGGRGPGMGHGGPGMGGGMGGPGMGGRGAHLDAAATALGITADELKTELEAGKTIADVATEKGIDVQTVIDAIVAAETANITERVTDMVNGVKPTPPADAPADAPADDSGATTTTGG
jgi:hypothetical protein